MSMVKQQLESMSYVFMLHFKDVMQKILHPVNQLCSLFVCVLYANIRNAPGLFQEKWLLFTYFLIPVLSSSFCVFLIILVLISF